MKLDKLPDWAINALWRRCQDRFVFIPYGTKQFKRYAKITWRVYTERGRRK